MECLKGTPNSEEAEQEEGEGTGAPESPALFLMILAWFIVAMNREARKMVDAKIMQEAERILPHSSVGFMDDLTFPPKHPELGEARLRFTGKAGPWCGFFHGAH